MREASRVTGFLIAGMLMACATADSMPRDSDDKQFAREKVKIPDMAAKRDTAGLMAMLRGSEFRSTELAAYWLGRLGVSEALPELDRLHKQNRNLVCPQPSGAFGAAAARIRVAGLPPSEQVTQLLKIATGADYQPTPLETTDSHGKTVVTLAADRDPDRVLTAEVGRILVEYDDPRILPSLRRVRNYGAQETALRLETRSVPQAKRLGFLVDTLVKHETPQRAEAAQLLLTEAAKKGADAVMGLLADNSWEKGNVLVNTVRNRAFHIVSKAGDRQQAARLRKAGWVWGSPLPQPAASRVPRDEKRRLAAVAGLSDNDYLVRFRAAMDLRKMLPDARNIPALRRVANDKEVIVERAALEALAKIDSPQIEAVMLWKLKSPRSEFRYIAAQALWARGYKRPVRVFVADLRSGDPEVRKWADRRLERLTGVTGNYWYGDPEPEREKNVKWWETWVAKQKR